MPHGVHAGVFDADAAALHAQFKHTYYKKAFLYRDVSLTGTERGQARCKQDHWLYFQDYLNANQERAHWVVGKITLFVKSVNIADPNEIYRTAICGDVWRRKDRTHVPKSMPEAVDPALCRAGGVLLSIVQSDPIDLGPARCHAVNISEDVPDLYRVTSLVMADPARGRDLSTIPDHVRGCLFFVHHSKSSGVR